MSPPTPYWSVVAEHMTRFRQRHARAAGAAARAVRGRPCRSGSRCPASPALLPTGTHGRSCASLEPAVARRAGRVGRGPPRPLGASSAARGPTAASLLKPVDRDGDDEDRPVTTCCQKLWTPAIERPFWSVPMKRTPTAVPVTPPTPPRKLVPPRSTAAAAFERDVRADLRARGAEAAGLDHAADACAEAGDRVDEDQRARDVDARQARGLDVAADGVHVAAEVGPAQDDERDEERRDHDPDRRRDAEAASRSRSRR